MSGYYIIFCWSLVLLGISCQLPVTNQLSNGSQNMDKTILWSQDSISHNNYRIPALIVTHDSTILAFCEGREGGDAGDIDLLVKRSTDNGRSWSRQSIVWDDTTNTCGNPCPVVDQRTGRILLLMTWNLGTDKEADIIRKRSQSTRIPYMTTSDDDGLTWSTPRSLKACCKEEDWGWYATGPGNGIQLQNGSHAGRIIVPCNNSYDNPEITNRDGFGYGAHVLISDDYGETWRKSEIITPEVNESQIVELQDGRLVMNMRSYHGKGCRAICYSDDGGETWTDVEHDLQLVEPVCQASILHYGTWKNHDLYLFSNPATTFARSHMTIKSSTDACDNWSNAKLIHSGPSAYSSLTRLKDGRIGLLFEGGIEHPYEHIQFLAFQPDLLFVPGELIARSK